MTPDAETPQTKIPSPTALMTTIDPRHEAIIAQALYDKVRQMDLAMFESHERYGYGPIVTCDTEEEHSNISSRREEAMVALKALAFAGSKDAQRELDHLADNDAHHTALYEKTEKTAPKRGTKVAFWKPIMVPGPKYDGKGGRVPIPKRGGVFCGFVIHPNCHVIYKVEVRKHCVVNVYPHQLRRVA
jgi:hypothetical protein